MFSPWSCAEDGTLHLSNVQQNDAGEYYCTAENRGGRDQRQTILSVAGKAKEPTQILWMGFISCFRKTCKPFFPLMQFIQKVCNCKWMCDGIDCGEIRRIILRDVSLQLGPGFLRLAVSVNTLLHSEPKLVQLPEPHSRQDWFCLQ